MPNPFVHVELNSHDVAASKKFYSKLFDWKLTDTPMGPITYTMIAVGKGVGRVGGGIMPHPMPDAPPMWLSYVEVDDVKKTIAKAAKLGATIIVDYKDVGMGALGIFTDPSGATIGLWAPAPPKKSKAKPKKRR